jgi:hypothetical protein
MLQRTWKPIAAGVVAMIGGTLDIVAALAFRIYLSLGTSGIAPQAVVPIEVLLLAAGIGAIVGGSFSVRRKHWGLGLAGSICAITPPLMTLGILSTVWIAISRNEFS